MTLRVKWVALAVAALCPATAAAAPPWSPTTPLGTNVVELAGGSGSIAPLADGDALVAWQQEAAPGSGVRLATVTPMGLWPATNLDPLGRSPQVATNAADAAVVVWIGTDGVYAVLRGADGELTAARRILDVPPDREVRRLDVAAAGRTIGGGLRAVVVAILDNNALYAQGGGTGSVVALRLDSGA
jgi:hypothetical protein